MSTWTAGPRREASQRPYVARQSKAGQFLSEIERVRSTYRADYQAGRHEHPWPSDRPMEKPTAGWGNEEWEGRARMATVRLECHGPTALDATDTEALRRFPHPRFLAGSAGYQPRRHLRVVPD